MDDRADIATGLMEAASLLEKLSRGSGWNYWATTSHVEKLSNCLLVTINALNYCLDEIDRIKSNAVNS